MEKGSAEISLRPVTTVYYLCCKKYAKMSKQHAFIIRSLSVAKMTTLLIMKSLLITKKSNQFRVVKSFLMTAHLTLKKSLLPIKKGLPLNIVMQPMETGWINWTLPYKYSKQKFIRTASSYKTVRSELRTKQKDKIFQIF